MDQDSYANLECPYDLSDPKQQMLWQIDLTKHWYREAFKISFPRLYTMYRTISLSLQILYYKLRSMTW